MEEKRGGSRCGGEEEAVDRLEPIRHGLIGLSGTPQLGVTCSLQHHHLVSTPSLSVVKAASLVTYSSRHFFKFSVGYSAV